MRVHWKFTLSCLVTFSEFLSFSQTKFCLRILQFADELFISFGLNFEVTQPLVCSFAIWFKFWQSFEVRLDLGSSRLINLIRCVNAKSFWMYAKMTHPACRIQNVCDLCALLWNCTSKKLLLNSCNEHGIFCNTERFLRQKINSIKFLKCNFGTLEEQCALALIV